MSASAKPDLETFEALARAGAEQAAAAFGQLVRSPIAAAPPTRVQTGDTETGAAPRDPDATGVFFEFEGCLDALVGLVFPGDASERLVRRITGLEDGALEPPVVESALMEVGNILASHVASAIADRLESRLLPSIPSLAMCDADTALEAFLERVVGPDAPRFEARLANADGSLGGRLVMVPSR